MKKYLLLIICGIIFISAYSQNPQLPNPRINTVAKADLVITAINFISIKRETTFSWLRISVTIKNTGDLRTGNTTLKGESKSLVSGSLPNRWESLSPVQSVISINPGQSVTKEYLFKVSNTMAHKKFAIKVIADSGNVADESNERNNTSAELIINPL
jgi:hypothetical protein